MQVLQRLWTGFFAVGCSYSVTLMVSDTNLTYIHHSCVCDLIQDAKSPDILVGASLGFASSVEHMCYPHSGSLSF